MNLLQSPFGSIIALIIEALPIIFGVIIAFIIALAVKIFPTMWIRYLIGSLLSVFFTFLAGFVFTATFYKGVSFIVGLGPLFISLPVSLITFILFLLTREKKVSR